VARIFNTYGPSMQINDGRVVSNFIVQALQNQDITIYGDGTQTRAFCYVSDLIEGFLRLMQVDGCHEPVNLGNPNERTISELVESVLAEVKTSSTIQFYPLPSDDPTRRCPDISRARTLLDWEPRISFEDGLRSTVAYFRSKLL